MGEKIERLEQIFNGKIEQKDQRAIPGLIAREDVGVVYFSSPPKGNVRRQFRRIANHTSPPFAQSGGVSESGCTIQSPEGDFFHAITYRGDLDGWQKDIEAGAKACGSLLAKIDGHKLVVADGRSFDLAVCKVEFS